MRSAPETPEVGPAKKAEAPSQAPVRVLVTGFNDWRELGDPPQLWRCRDNPSCRLLLGDETQTEPSGADSFDGPLVARLRAAQPEIEWTFATMPVTWGVFAEVPSDRYEVIVNLGLGVYDRFDALQLEAGAYDLRQGKDAAGVERAEAIRGEADRVLAAPQAVAARVQALEGERVAGYEVVVAKAREDNAYLCNETHFSALSALAEGGADDPLRAAYFLHIPYAKDGDYEALAEGVAGLVLRLVEP
ncbi:hypothetical protein PPSIR1_13515 [Plesiocystis pacifica SIR-1]|uniref:Pyrrolidone-carboxylate peptidase n=1 Tax=Plesiocystis pacifica SIR-1 TaxID=391625 RepID=A6GF03_9BACT|nr:hypothetical protein PPSIR1_13515 [Plesiocystis pacifica SIR-1]